MKNIIIIIASICFVTTSFSQSPMGIPYQAILRDANGQPLLNTPVTTRFTLREQTPTGSISYQETHNTSTSNQGLIALTFGQGTPSVGTFESINWSQTIKFLQVETDLGNGYTEIGTQQLMSVPYALYSGSGGSTSNSGNTLSTDSVLTLYSTFTQSSCDFIVPEGESWKVVAINKNNSQTTTFSVVEAFSFCAPNVTISQSICYYTRSSTTNLCQIGQLQIQDGASYATTGSSAAIIENQRVGFYTTNCGTCPSTATFNYSTNGVTLPSWNLPIWCSSGQSIKCANSIVLTIEKYK